MAHNYRWSITVLTLPERSAYLKALVKSLAKTKMPGRAEVVVVYNVRGRGATHLLEKRIHRWAPDLDVSVYFNSQDRSIAGGRNFQLNLCRGDLVCIVDDDITLHGDVFPALEATLRAKPLGVIGVRALTNDSRTLFKPRPTTPYVDLDGIRFTTVQGCLAAGYRELWEDIGGFNPRRRFWGEWTEFNLRLWRLGYPTGYPLDGGFVRHWLNAPSSPTRSLEGRHAHVLWGLICTAIEYDAVDATAATAAFWKLIEERYLSYSFGKDLTPNALLRTTLELMPRISEEWGALSRFKAEVATHPFPFKPFQALDADDVRAVLTHATTAIARYRERAFGTQPRPPRRPVGAPSLLQRVLRRRTVRVEPA